jgi:hypothetical protein
MKTGHIIFAVLALAVLVATLTGCTGQQKQGPSGFLQNYPPFEKGPEGIDKRYVNPDVNFGKYDKVMMDEVVFFFKTDADYKGIKPSEINELSEAFHKTFVEVMRDIMTDSPGPNVIRMRLAVTDLEPSSPVGGTMSTIIPVGLAYSLAKKGTTGEYAGIGSASMEAEFLDSMSNDRIGAVIDTVPGGKFDVGKLSPAKSAFEFWANRLRAFMSGVKEGQ